MSRLPYYNSELSRVNLDPSFMATREAMNLLEDGRLRSEIEEGNITLAMIRPNVGPDANLLGLTDLEAADEIESLIKNLGFAAKFSFTFNTAAVEEFYGGDPQESMSKEVSQDSERYPNRWLEFVEFMTSGPTTAILLYDPNHDAIPLWRAHLGHWNIDKERNPDTIRGKLGVDKYNNLVHGSDSPGSVVREIGIIKDCLRTTMA